MSTSWSWLGPVHDDENSGELVLLKGIGTLNVLNEINAIKTVKESVRPGYEPSCSVLSYQGFFRPDVAEEIGHLH